MGVFCANVLGQPALATDERFASNSKAHAPRARALRAIIARRSRRSPPRR